MEYTELKNVCNINMGQSPESSTYNEKGIGLPFFQGNADFGEKYPITRVWCNVPTKVAHTEDILISVRAPIGALNYAKEDCCIGRGLAAITPDNTKFSSEFIFWLLKGKNTELNSKGTGSTFKAISRKVLEEIKVPDISFEEQYACATNLERVYSVIRSRKLELQILDNLIKARFVEMFGDPVSATKEKKKLSDIGRIYTGNTPSMKNPEYYSSEDIPFVKPGDIAESGVSLIKQVDSFISEKARNVARIIPQDAVLVTCIGTIGKIGIATQECCCNQQINYIVPSNDVDSVYLAYCISFFKDVLADMANAPVVPIINKTQFSALEIPIAENCKQLQFSKFVQQVDKSKFAVQKALDKAQLLFDSLMQQYFG